MKVSVIIPIYNHLEAFHCVAESLQYIDYDCRDYEVIVVDDGSGEDIQTIVKKYVGKLKLRYIRQETNLGRSVARNRGIREAKGELLIFNDGDRILLPDFIQQHVETHQSNEKSVCIGNCVDLIVFDPTLLQNPKKMMEEISQKKSRKFQKCRYYYQEVVEKIYDLSGETSCQEAWISLLSGNFSMKRQDAIAVGGFDEHFKGWGIENIEFGYRLLKSGLSYSYNRNAVNYHIYHKQERDVLNLDQAFSYFLCKAQDQAVLRYYDFLRGKISLNELTVGYTGCEEYYISNRLGSRYRV